MKYIEGVRKCFASRPGFSIQDLRVFLKRRGIGEAYTHQLIHHLLERGELKRVTRGAYSFSDDTQLVGFAFQPYYYGLQDALSFHGLWEQETNPVVITPRRVRTGLRKFEGNNYLVRRISRKMFYGFQQIEYAGHWINVSDIEKTLIDFAYFNEPLSLETLREIKARMSKKRLREHLAKCNPKTKRKTTRLLAIV